MVLTYRYVGACRFCRFSVIIVWVCVGVCVCACGSVCLSVCVCVCVCVVRDAFEVKEEVGIFPVRDKVRISFLLSSVVVDTVQCKSLSS